jgi:hypothetical protein
MSTQLQIFPDNAYRKRQPVNIRNCFQFAPHERTAEAAAARESTSPWPLRSCYVADLNGYRVTQDMLRHPSGPAMRDLVAAGMAIRTSYNTGPYLVKRISAHENYGVKCYSFACTGVDRHGEYYLNDYVAVDGRILHLFLANDDELIIEKEVKVVIQPALFYPDED